MILKVTLQPTMVDDMSTINVSEIGDAHASLHYVAIHKVLKDRT